MTIDELKFEISDAKMASAFYAEKARDFQIKNGASDDYNLFLSEHYTKYADVLEELKWWREQDLIRRDDAIREIMDIADYYNSKSEHFAEYAVTGCGNALGILPKAEPPHATVDERNGDCETCKHYAGTGARWCKSCSRTYLDNYEPYIPKENER